MKNNSNLTLRVAETNPKFVGRGIALLDPKVMEELNLWKEKDFCFVMV